MEVCILNLTRIVFYLNFGYIIFTMYFCLEFTEKLGIFIYMYFLQNLEFIYINQQLTKIFA